MKLNESLCVYDAAKKLGVEVRFVTIPSLEGMYVKPSPGLSPLILVSADRPPGRQASTCAHELGHHAYKHGTRIDQYVAGAGTTLPHASPTEAEEVLAAIFGGYFLMPKAAVERGFRTRGFVPGSATAREVFIVAGWLGVGYATLVHHMRSSLKLLSNSSAEKLLAAKPVRLREQLVGEPTLTGVLVVDKAWTGRPVDVQTGDLLIVPIGTEIEADQSSPITILRHTRSGALLVEAVQPGIGRVSGPGWENFVRVARRGYYGRSEFRHLEASEPIVLERPEHDQGENEE